MKLFNSIILTLIGLLMLTTSCQNKKSYSEYLKDEKRAIDLFIAKNNLVVLKEFPEDGKFKDNEFYKDSYTGVYFNIISRGDTAKPKFGEEIFIRFKGLHYFMTDDTIRYTNHYFEPERFIYFGPVTSVTRDRYNVPGWAVPLSYVGHTGKVKMIIPFDFGSNSDRKEKQPTYYEQVQYRFSSQW